MAAKRSGVEAAWAAWGTLAPDVITQVLSSFFMGGPRWPSREAYRVARAGDAVLIASDGLADLGLEVFAVTDDALGVTAGADLTAYAQTWLYDIVHGAANLAARHGRISELLDKFGNAITSELYEVRLPASHRKRLVNKEQRVGVVFAQGLVPGVPATVKRGKKTVKLVAVQLLTLDELAYSLKVGERAPAEIAKQLAGNGMSRLDRPSVFAKAKPKPKPKPRVKSGRSTERR